MKKLALALAAAACLSAPVQAVAQSKPAPAIESKSAKAEGWTSGKILAVAGGAVVGILAADIIVPGIMMKNAIGLIGGAVLGYYWYTNELPQPMSHRVSDADGSAKVVMTNM